MDVPDLDAVIFLHPRKSQADVIQAVGHVMCRAKRKKRDYIILPVGVPAGFSAEQSLRYNKKYKVVWQVLNVLLAHDENFGKTLNQMVLGQDISHTLEIVALQNMTTVVDKISINEKTERMELATGTPAIDPYHNDNVQSRFPFCVEFPNSLKALIAKKTTVKDYWEVWGNNVAEIAQNHITQLQNILSDESNAFAHVDHRIRARAVENFISMDAKKISWNHDLKDQLAKGKIFETEFEEIYLTQSSYRPFTRQ